MSKWLPYKGHMVIKQRLIKIVNASEENLIFVSSYLIVHRFYSSIFQIKWVKIYNKICLCTVLLKVCTIFGSVLATLSNISDYY